MYQSNVSLQPRRPRHPLQGFVGLPVLLRRGCIRSEGLPIGCPRALARLENYGMALTAFRRAVGLSRKIGSRNRAAEAALAAFQEME